MRSKSLVELTSNQAISQVETMVNPVLFGAVPTGELQRDASNIL